MVGLLIMLAAALGPSTDIRLLLHNQGFTGPINGRESINYVGHIRQGRDDYQVYAYSGLVRAAVIDHGVNRLIVMRNGDTLIGSYDASVRLACSVRGASVVCNAGVVEFTRSGPPLKVMFDGEPQKMALGNNLKK